MMEYPEKYMIGQEYAHDNKTDIVMKFYANVSCVFPTVNIEEKDIKIYFNHKYWSVIL